MEHIRHISMSIAGALRNFGRRKMGGLIQDDDGRDWSDREVRNYLKEGLAKGWKYIPCCDCQGFDYQKECPGHEVIKEKTEK